MLYDIQFQMASKVDEIQVDNTSAAQLAQSLPKHYQTTKNPSKRYQEILQLPNHYQVATIFGVICDQQITTR